MYLITNYGFNSLSDLLSTSRRMHSFENGMQAILGISSDDFEVMAHQYLTEKYRLIFLFIDNTFWWIGITLLCIVGFFVTIRRNRKRALELQEEERRETMPRPDNNNAESADVDQNKDAIEK